jgi:hypothetical protein
MPLFTVTMKSSRSASEKDCLSRAIHAASVGWSSNVLASHADRLHGIK